MKVRLPSPLYDYSSGRREIEANGNSLSALLADMDKNYPGIRFRMVDEQEQIRPHLKIFVNLEITRSLATPLSSADEIDIVVAISGG